MSARKKFTSTNTNKIVAFLLCSVVVLYVAVFRLMTSNEELNLLNGEAPVFPQSETGGGPDDATSQAGVSFEDVPDDATSQAGVSFEDVLNYACVDHPLYSVEALQTCFRAENGGVPHYAIEEKWPDYRRFPPDKFDHIDMTTSSGHYWMWMALCSDSADTQRLHTFGLNRVDMADAEVFYVGLDGFLNGLVESCLGATWLQREVEFDRHLESLGVFQRLRGADFVLTGGPWRAVYQNVSNGALAQLKERAIWVNPSPSPLYLRDRPYRYRFTTSPRKFIPILFPPNAGLMHCASLQDRQVNKPFYERPLSFYAVAAPRPYNTQCFVVRTAVANVFKDAPNATVSIVALHATDGVHGVKMGNFHSCGEYAEQMWSSRYCVVPTGDHRATRRLTDALYAGCIPIIINNCKTYFSELPSTDLWSAVECIDVPVSFEVDNRDPNGQSSPLVDVGLQLTEEAIRRGLARILAKENVIAQAHRLEHTGLGDAQTATVVNELVERAAKLDALRRLLTPGCADYNITREHFLTLTCAPGIADLSQTRMNTREGDSALQAMVTVRQRLRKGPPPPLEGLASFLWPPPRTGFPLETENFVVEDTANDESLCQNILYQSCSFVRGNFFRAPLVICNQGLGLLRTIVDEFVTQLDGERIQCNQVRKLLLQDGFENEVRRILIASPPTMRLLANKSATVKVVSDFERISLQTPPPPPPSRDCTFDDWRMKRHENDCIRFQRFRQVPLDLRPTIVAMTGKLGVTFHSVLYHSHTSALNRVLKRAWWRHSPQFAPTPEQVETILAQQTQAASTLSSMTASNAKLFRDFYMDDFNLSNL